MSIYGSLPPYWFNKKEPVFISRLFKSIENVTEPCDFKLEYEPGLASIASKQRMVDGGCPTMWQQAPTIC